MAYPPQAFNVLALSPVAVPSVDINEVPGMIDERQPHEIVLLLHSTLCRNIHFFRLFASQPFDILSKRQSSFSLTSSL
jgi:hypothetical protein